MYCTLVLEGVVCFYNDPIICYLSLAYAMLNLTHFVALGALLFSNLQ